MYKPFFIILLIAFLFSCNGKGQKKIPYKQDKSPDTIKVSEKYTNQNKDTGIKIYSYGIASRGNFTDQLVAKKYGFQYIPGGCTISKEQADEAEANNKKARLLLEKINGKGWEERLEADLSKAHKTNNQVAALAFKEPYIIQLNKEIREKKDYIHFQISPANEHNIFDVKAYAWDEGKKQDIAYYTLKVNLNTQKIILISGKQGLLSK